MRIGTPRRFERFARRCFEEAFRRLDELLQMQLACYVESLTYLVRRHYQGCGTNSCSFSQGIDWLMTGLGWNSILEALSSQNPSLSRLHTRLLGEQNTFVETNNDTQKLHRGIANFPSLQETRNQTSSSPRWSRRTTRLDCRPSRASNYPKPQIQLESCLRSRGHEPKHRSP